MLKKVLIGLTVVLAAGGGVWYMTSPASQIAGQRLSALSERRERAGSQEKEPIAKLVYVGTNETLSEALYNLDRQDGKLERPYIVHKVLGSTPDLGDNRHSLTFIGKDGKVKEEEILESNKSKIDVYITPKGYHALVYRDYDGWALVTAQYYDINGNLLWEKKDSFNSYAFFPDGDLLIEDVSHKDGRDYNLINAKGELVKKDFYSIEYSRIHPDYSGATKMFSPNGQYFSLQYDDGNNKVTNVLVFNRSGKLLYRKDQKEFTPESGAYLSDSGHYYLLGYEPYYSPYKHQIFFVFDGEGREIYKRAQESEKRINEFAVLDDSHIYIVARYKTPKDRLLRLINIRIPEETVAYKGNSVGKVILCCKMPVFSNAEWIGDVASREIALIKNNEIHSIYKYSTAGYNPYLFEINDFICSNDMLILKKASDKVERIYKIRR